MRRSCASASCAGALLRLRLRRRHTAESCNSLAKVGGQSHNAPMTGPSRAEYPTSHVLMKLDVDDTSFHGMMICTNQDTCTPRTWEAHTHTLHTWEVHTNTARLKLASRSFATAPRKHSTSTCYQSTQVAGFTVPRFCMCRRMRAYVHDIVRGLSCVDIHSPRRWSL
jgi:hypothetical protein